MTQYYIGIDQITGWEEVKDGQEGYSVKDAQGYMSWLPKDTFESRYYPQGNDPTKTPNENDPTRITQQMVDDFIVDFDVHTMHDKITVVVATLKSGFTIVESSACADPANYDEAIGISLCMEKIRDKIWNHLGFVLQWAKDGV